MTCSRCLLIPLIIACMPTTSSPTPFVRTALKRLLPATLATGALYFGYATDGKKTRSTVWAAAQKINEHTSEKVSTVQTLLEASVDEQKDDHALIINTVAGLQKQAKSLKAQQDTTLDEIYDIKAQQTALLEEIHTVKIMLAALLEQKAQTPVPQAPTRTLATRGGIVVETQEASC